MVNRRRGEVSLLIGGVRRTLCLTLGALAALETAFGVTDLLALAERFGSGRLSSRDLLLVLAAGLQGGGATISEEELASLTLDEGLEPVTRAIADLLLLTFGGADESKNPR